MEQPKTEESADRKLCIACKQEFSGNETVCPNDGTTLTQLTMEPNVGSTVGDKYEIMAVIGGGAMGLVYKARHLLMKRIVALKMLHPNMVVDEGTVKRFQKEAEALSCLNHPNILTVFDFGVSKQGQPFLVTDYLEGLTLAQVLEQTQRLDWRRTVGIFTQVTSALAHAHRNGVIHRDIKPSNIMLIHFEDQNDFVKILDFGIAKVISEQSDSQAQLTRTGEVFGSPLYMSPEQCRGKGLDARSDMYSLGCVLYRCLTGQPALYGQDLVECLYKHVHETPVALRQAAPDADIPPELEATVAKCLEKDPSARFQTMADLKDALNTVLAEVSSDSILHQIPQPGRFSPSTAVASDGSQSSSLVQTVTSQESPSQEQQQRLEATSAEVLEQSIHPKGRDDAPSGTPLPTETVNDHGASVKKQGVILTISCVVLLIVAGFVAMNFVKKGEEPEKPGTVSSTKPPANNDPSDDSYENLLREATEDFQSGYYTEAKEQFEQALQQAKKNGASKANTANILHHLILAAIEDTSFDSAKKYLKELETLAGITDQTKTPTSREAAEAFYDQAAILMFQSSKDSKVKAEQLFSKALIYYSNTSGVGIDRMRTLSRLGQLALMNGDLQKAKDYMKQAVAVAEEDPSISQLELALRLDQLGDTYVLLANSTHSPKVHYQDAENLYSRALQLRRSVVRSDQHPALALSYKRLGIMYFHKEDFGKAMDELNKSLEILKKNEAPLPMIAEIQRAISYVYLKQHDFDVAKKTFEDAIKTATAGGTTPGQVSKWRKMFDSLQKAESKHR